MTNEMMNLRALVEKAPDAGGQARWAADDAGQLLRATLAGQEGQPRGQAQA